MVSDGLTNITTSSAILTVSVNVIFTTTSVFNGNLGGIAGADAKCNSDSNRVIGLTYKALMSGLNVTKVGTKYYRNDMTTFNCNGYKWRFGRINSISNPINPTGSYVLDNQHRMFRYNSTTHPVNLVVHHLF